MAARSSVLLAIAGLALVGCTGSARFGDFGGSPAPVSARSEPSFGQPTAPEPMRRPSSADDVIAQPLEPQSRESVSAESLTDLQAEARQSAPGSAIAPALNQAAEAPSATASAAQSGITSQATAAGGTGAAAVPANPASLIAPEPSSAAETRVAALPRQERAPSAGGGGGGAVGSIAGTYTVTDAGDRCRLTLTSSPLFEFYRASPQNCRSPSLARVNAWEQRGSEVVLLRPGGQVAARLFPQGSGYSGATASGATITMQR